MTQGMSISSAERASTGSYEADSWFPDLDQDPEWEITADSEEQTYFDIAYTFLRYERKKG